MSDRKRSFLLLSLGTVVFATALATSRWANIWLTTAAAGIACLVSYWFLFGTSRNPTKRSKPTTAVVATAVGVLSVLATHLGYALILSIAPGLEHEVVTLYSQLQQPPGPVIAFPLLVLVVSAEELVWRGQLFSQLTGLMPPPMAIVLSSALYALPQLFAATLLLCPVAFGLGCLWAILRHYTNSVFAPLWAHLIWSSSIMLLFPLASIC